MESFLTAEENGTYTVHKSLSKSDILNMAISIAKEDLATGVSLTKPCLAVSSLRSLLMSETREIFAVLFLDTKHRVIKLEEMFKGTINSAAVYPREVAKRALELNSQSVILCHNHPSGDTNPSEADKRVTAKIRQCLDVFDIEVMDHFIVSPESYLSFKEEGLM